LNAILAKIGSADAISLILAIVKSNCIPVLMYGLAACKLSTAQQKALIFPYNAVFCKIFKSYDKTIVMSSQFYSGFLPAVHAHHLATLRFLHSLKPDLTSPAGALFRYFGQDEVEDLNERYNVPPSALPDHLKRYFWDHFTTICEESGGLSY